MRKSCCQQRGLNGDVDAFRPRFGIAPARDGSTSRCDNRRLSAEGTERINLSSDYRPSLPAALLRSLRDVVTTGCLGRYGIPQVRPTSPCSRIPVSVTIQPTPKWASAAAAGLGRAALARESARRVPVREGPALFVFWGKKRGRTAAVRTTGPVAKRSATTFRQARGELGQALCAGGLAQAPTAWSVVCFRASRFVRPGLRIRAVVDVGDHGVIVVVFGRALSSPCQRGCGDLVDGRLWEEVALASKFHDGPPTELVGRFRVVG